MKSSALWRRNGWRLAASASPDSAGKANSGAIYVLDHFRGDLDFDGQTASRLLQHLPRYQHRAQGQIAFEAIRFKQLGPCHTPGGLDKVNASRAISGGPEGVSWGRRIDAAREPEFGA